MYEWKFPMAGMSRRQSEYIMLLTATEMNYANVTSNIPCGWAGWWLDLTSRSVSIMAGYPANIRHWADVRPFIFTRLLSVIPDRNILRLRLAEIGAMATL